MKNASISATSSLWKVSSYMKSSNASQASCGVSSS